MAGLGFGLMAGAIMICTIVWLLVPGIAKDEPRQGVAFAISGGFLGLASATVGAALYIAEKLG